MTMAATGSSTEKNTTVALEACLSTILAKLGVAPVTFGVLFASPQYDLRLALSTLGKRYPTAEFIGSNTAGEFTEAGRTDGGMALLLVSSSTLLASSAAVSNIKTDWVAGATQLAAPFHQMTKRASALGYGVSTTLLLVDSLSGAGEKILKEVQKATRLFQPIVGGAAGDDGKFSTPQVGNQQLTASDCASVLHIYGKTSWGVGIDHGLKPQTKPMTVTRAGENEVFEIDGKPAIETYRAYAQSRGVTLNEANTSSYLIGNELGVYFLNEMHHARAPVGVGPQGSLKLVADIPEGSRVCILDGEKDSMVAACERASREALKNLNGTEPAAVIVFDCVCRGMILGKEFNREIDAVKKVFPQVPVIGFLTYGEIARVRGKLDGWHNTTSVVVAIPK